MFELLKEKLDIVTVVTHFTEKEVIPCGEANVEMEDKSCPFCSHNDCFRIKTSDNFFKCFSCDTSGDIIAFVSAYKELGAGEAARLIAKEFNISLPSNYSPTEEIFGLAANYYNVCLREAGANSALKDMTPVQYQETVRGHKLQTLDSMLVGWSDGGLIEYLKSVGVEESLIEASGLMNKRGKDFLPSNCFIYAHKVNKRVSHFTFKDPMKQQQYQLPKKYTLNNYAFYNQDSIIGRQRVIIVEGENDLLSVIEAGWPEGVIATIGQLSVSQIDWMLDHLGSKDVITIFDPDEAGDKYRDKLSKIKHKFKSLTQIKTSTDMDVDELIRSGKTMHDILQEVWHDSPGHVETEDGGVITTEELSANAHIAEKGGCYYRLRYKEGEVVPILITNFTIKLRNIFIRGMRRDREIVIIRSNGRSSKPVVVTSDEKVSLKSFKSLIANAIDGSFYGKEDDLPLLWDYIYQTSAEREVLIPNEVGHVKEVDGWLFKECFVSDSGVIIEHDNEGIFSLNDKTSGIKAVDLNVDATGEDGCFTSIPSLYYKTSPERAEELEEIFVRNLTRNLGDVGKAITLLSWVMASAHSDYIFKSVGSFPMLFLWGKHGKGKTYICKWLLNLYGMEETGYSTTSQYKTGVGFGRKMAYYSSLPLCLDEIRTDAETKLLYQTFRGWWNRVGRDLGTREGFGIRHLPVNSTIIFSGQDQFDDSATSSRCVYVRIAKDNRELVETFKIIDSVKHQLSAIGFKWIVESTRADRKAIIDLINQEREFFHSKGLSSRAALNMATLVPFAAQLVAKYFPGVDFRKEFLKEALVETQTQEEGDIVHRFFEVVEQNQIGNNPIVTNQMVMREGNRLFLWFSSVFDALKDRVFDRTQEGFSKRAVLNALKEEIWVVSVETRKSMPGNGQSIQRRVVEINLDNAPEIVKNIGWFYDEA